MSILLPTLTIVLYGLCAIALGMNLVKHDLEHKVPKSVILTTAVIALALHALQMFPLIFSNASFNLGFFNALSLVSWIIVLLMIVAVIKKPVENLGIILFPWAALTIFLELNLDSERFVPADAPWQLQAHILISMVAYGLLALAMVQALLLAFQDYHLRNRQPGGLIRGFPPLQTMETILFQLIAVGFISLTLGLLIGVLFLDGFFGKHLAHKTVLSFVAWAIFAVLLWGRKYFGWRGKTAIRWTLGGFFSLMLAYFGSKLVLELILQR